MSLDLPAQPDVTGRLIVSNASGAPMRYVLEHDSALVLRLEPWADETLIRAGKRVRVTFTGPGRADLEVEFADGVLTIYGRVDAHPGGRDVAPGSSR